MTAHGGAPAARPCGTCPYRVDVPSGVWDASEYEKLPPYDLPTGDQPHAAFFCHQQDGRLCAGWVGCHDMNESIGLRLAVAVDSISSDAYRAALDYSTDVPLHGSGAEACAHGLADVEEPGPDAERAIAKLSRRRRR